MMWGWKWWADGRNRTKDRSQRPGHEVADPEWGRRRQLQGHTEVASPRDQDGSITKHGHKNLSEIYFT